MNKNAILVELLERSKAHSKGVSLIFQETPIQIDGDFPSITELQLLQQNYPVQFDQLIRFLYPEKFPAGTAGAFDWMTLVGGVLSGAGAGLSQIGSNQNGQSAAESELAALKLQQEAAAETKAEYRKYLIIGGVIFAVILITIAVLVFRKK